MIYVNRIATFHRTQKYCFLADGHLLTLFTANLHAERIGHGSIPRPLGHVQRRLGPLTVAQA
jgi:hypothetical protein